MSSCWKISFDLEKISSDNLIVEDEDEVSTTALPPCCNCKINKYLSTDKLNHIMYDVMKYSLSHKMDEFRVHSDRLRGLGYIRKILKRSNYTDLDVTQIIAITWACLSILHHFHIRVLPENTYYNWLRKREYMGAMNTYEQLLALILPHLFTTVMKSHITFFTAASLWDMESFVTNCFRKILMFSTNPEVVVERLLELIEITEDMVMAKNLLRIMHNLCIFVDWEEAEEDVLTPLIECYRRTVMGEEMQALRGLFDATLRTTFLEVSRDDLIDTVRYRTLGLEHSHKRAEVQCMVKWAECFIAKDDPIVFGDLMEFAANTKNEIPFTRNLPLILMRSLLALVVTDDADICTLCCRVIFHLFDRQKNPDLLDPKVFFLDEDDVEVVLRVGEFSLNDRTYFRKIARLTYKNLLSAVVKHAGNVKCMESIYAVLAVLVVEIPCSYTVAYAAAFVMSAQQIARLNPSMVDEHGYTIHACNAFILSVICYAHKTTELFEHVNEVVRYRAHIAPQMNPPLWREYKIHPLRNQSSDLFFTDWALRYGLCSHFLSGTIDVAKLDREEELERAEEERLKEIERLKEEEKERLKQEKIKAKMLEMERERERFMRRKGRLNRERDVYE